MGLDTPVNKPPDGQISCVVLANARTHAAPPFSGAIKWFYEVIAKCFFFTGMRARRVSGDLVERRGLSAAL
jgi:hypothetical protein